MLRALVPAGWMPVAASQSHGTLMPCPMMDGARGMRMPQQTPHPSKHQLPASHEGSICAFATPSQPVRAAGPQRIALTPEGAILHVKLASLLAPEWDHAARAPPAAA